MIYKLLFIFVFLIQITYAKNTGEKQMTNILTNKPYFSIFIDKSYGDLFITLNGEIVYENYFTNEEVSTEVPVNHFITSGKNVIEIKTLQSQKEKPNSTLEKNTKLTVQLRVKTSGTFDTEPITISKIVFDNSENDMNDKIKLSTKEGSYSSKNNFKQDENGDVTIYNNKIKEFNESRTGEPYNGYTINQSIKLQTPFPRWKFLDSDDIINKNYSSLSDDEYYKLLKENHIQAVYTLQKKIYNAIKAKDIDSIIDLFDERSEEIDAAFYREKGYTKKDFYDSLVQDANDDTLEMLEFDEKYKFFYISDGRKTLFIKYAIAFNVKGGGGNLKYHMYFRYQNGQWIITR